MKGFVLGVAVLPFVAGLAFASDQLGNAALDSVTAGFIVTQPDTGSSGIGGSGGIIDIGGTIIFGNGLTGVDCPASSCGSTSSTSSSNNGVTTSSSSSSSNGSSSGSNNNPLAAFGLK